MIPSNLFTKRTVKLLGGWGQLRCKQKLLKWKRSDRQKTLHLFFVQTSYKSVMIKMMMDIWDCNSEQKIYIFGKRQEPSHLFFVQKGSNPTTYFEDKDLIGSGN